MKPPAFIAKLGPRLDHHLRQEERQRHALSLVAAGAAFESWLAFETRLVVEENRKLLGLAGSIRGSHGIDRYEIRNEYRKIDLSVWDNADSSGRCRTALELKLIHNNKNWPAKVDAVHRDLDLGEETVKGKLEVDQRFALVAIVFKVYRKGVRYPGQERDWEDWKRRLWARLTPRGGRVKRVWHGGEHDISRGSCWLDPEVRAHFQLHALMRF